MQLKNLQLEGIFSIQNYHVFLLNLVSHVGQVILDWTNSDAFTTTGVQARPFLHKGIQSIKAKQNSKGANEDNKNM